MKIWAVGCSWTYGVGLKYPSFETYDTHIINYIRNEQKYWECNYSDAGMPNQFIFRNAIEIVEKMNKETDVLLVQWTSPFRQEMITTDGYAFYPPFDFASLKFLYGRNNELYDTLQLNNIQIDDFRKIGESTYKDIIKKIGKNFMNENYMELMSYNMQISLYHLLKSIGVKSLQFYAWDDCKIKSKNIWNMIPKNDVFLNETFQSVIKDAGYYLEGAEHPNKEMHKIFSKFLIEKLEKLNYITKPKII